MMEASSYDDIPFTSSIDGTVATMNDGLAPFSTPDHVPLEDTFWQPESTWGSDNEPSDEADSVACMTRVSTQEFRFCQDGQRFKVDPEPVELYQKSLYQDIRDRSSSVRMKYTSPSSLYQQTQPKNIYTLHHPTYMSFDPPEGAESEFFTPDLVHDPSSHSESVVILKDCDDSDDITGPVKQEEDDDLSLGSLVTKSSDDSTLSPASPPHSSHTSPVGNFKPIAVAAFSTSLSCSYKLATPISIGRPSNSIKSSAGPSRKITPILVGRPSSSKSLGVQSRKITPILISQPRSNKSLGGQSSKSAPTVIGQPSSSKRLEGQSRKSARSLGTNTTATSTATTTSPSSRSSSNQSRQSCNTGGSSSTNTSSSKLSRGRYRVRLEKIVSVDTQDDIRDYDSPDEDSPDEESPDEESPDEESQDEDSPDEEKSKEPPPIIRSSKYNNHRKKKLSAINQKTHTQKKPQARPQLQLTKRMPRHMLDSASCFQSEDGGESYQGTVIGKWQHHCEALWGTIFLDLWETYDSNTRKSAHAHHDDYTLATYDDELSYEDEGNVNVMVAIQATTLGSGFPVVLDPPQNAMPYVWGNNFVGMVQPPKGSTVHSRKFPPGCRVASICAWSAPSHKPYIACNSSHLLLVPPLDGLQLDSTEVAVLVAAYLPAFQALHHGTRHNRHLAHEPTALEGQRILILAHDSQDCSTMSRSLVDAQIQATVKLALWAGARDVHITVPKVGNSKRNIFGNDYRVRLLDTPPDDWVAILKARMDRVIDYTGGFSFLDREASTLNIVESVMAPKGRYVGVLGEDCSSTTMNCREEGPSGRSNKRSTWTESLPFLQGDQNCSRPTFLPEGRDIRHIVEWTTMCMKMKRACLFDFYYAWKQDRRLAEHDFKFLLKLLAKRQIRPHVAKILDVNDFPDILGSPLNQPRSPRPMSGAVVCEPWSRFDDRDDLSCCSDLS